MVFFTIYNLQDRTALISFLKTLLLENRRYRSHVLNYSLLSQLLGPWLHVVWCRCAFKIRRWNRDRDWNRGGDSVQ